RQVSGRIDGLYSVLQLQSRFPDAMFLAALSKTRAAQLPGFPVCLANVRVSSRRVSSFPSQSPTREINRVLLSTALECPLPIRVQVYLPRPAQPTVGDLPQ